MSGKRPASAASFTPMQTKWAAGLIAAFMAYALLQPLLNKQFGRQLPSLAALQQGDAPVRKNKQPPPEPAEPDSSGSHLPSETGGSHLPSVTGNHDNSISSDSRTRQERPTKTSPTKTSPTKTSPTKTSPTKTSPTKTGPSPASTAESLLYGVLRETAPDDFLSPGGLRYTRGSAEGHRLKHLERHLEDDPERPGKHGVFVGDMGQVIRWIDEGYALAKRGAKGTSQKEEDGRMVYEASFNKPIGFIGGRDGRRDHNPDAHRLRLVIDGNKVITAFPF